LLFPQRKSSKFGQDVLPTRETILSVVYIATSWNRFFLREVLVAEFGVWHLFAFSEERDVESPQNSGIKVHNVVSRQ